MRFLDIFNQYLHPGGEEIGIRQIHRGLESNGHQIIRFWKSSSDWRKPGAPYKPRQALLMWRNASVLREIESLHLKERPHAWICHNVLPIISLGIYPLAARLGVPVIQWLHNYRPLSPSGSLMVNNQVLKPDDPMIYWKESLAGTWRSRPETLWLSLCYRRAKRLGHFNAVRVWITLSEEMRKIFIQGGFPASRTFALRYPWKVETQKQEVRDDGSFLFLGRMLEFKGVKFLLDLWSRPELTGIPLILAGDGPLYDTFRRQTPSNIHWLGHVNGEHKKQALDRCRAVIFPSLWPEPLGLVVYEAYQHSKPVIGSDLGGIKETVFHRQTGFRVLPQRHDSWIEAILALTNDRDLARRYGENGYEWLATHCTPAAWGRTFDDILRQIEPII